jgi:lysophospholipase L1-like esterase
MKWLSLIAAGIGLSYGQTVTDWPNLAHYRAANAQLRPPAEGENRVVFMGDSITDFWGPRFPTEFPGKPYIGRGISGQTTPQMLIRFRPDVIDLKPKVVVILAGTNDIAGNTGPMTPEQIEGNLTSMAELAKVNGIKVVFSSVLPTNDYFKKMTGGRPNETIDQLNAWMMNYCRQSGDAFYLDYHSAMLDDQKVLRKELSDDGLHPNAAGYAVMAPLAEKAIATALGQPAN